jgi:hypothetical protein
MKLFLELVCATPGSFKLWFNDYCIGEMENVQGRFLYLLTPFLRPNVNWTFLEFTPLAFGPNHITCRVFDETGKEYKSFDFNMCWKTNAGKFNTKDFPENSVDTGFILSEDLEKDLLNPVWTFGEPVSREGLISFSRELWGVCAVKDLSKVFSLMAASRDYEEDFKALISSFLGDISHLLGYSDFNSLVFRNVWNNRLYEIRDEFGNPFLRRVSSNGDTSLQEAVPVFIGATNEGLKWVL